MNRRLSLTISTLLALMWASSACANKSELRIATLSPHLTEWVYALDKQSALVAVSAYSDYPKEALKLPVVADANGVNFRELLINKPNLVLVWEGGNKPQDISRIESSGMTVFRSSPATLDDIATEIRQLSLLIGAAERGQQIGNAFESQLSTLRNEYQRQTPIKVFYYMWTNPLMTIGDRAWGNRALNACGATTLYADAPNDYPEVRLADVLMRQPQALVTTLNGTPAELSAFWSTHNDYIDAPIISVNADIIHRFSPRILNEIERLCERLHALN